MQVSGSNSGHGMDIRMPPAAKISVKK